MIVVTEVIYYIRHCINDPYINDDGKYASMHVYALLNYIDYYLKVVYKHVCKVCHDMYQE